MSEEKGANQAVQAKQSVGPSDPIEPVVWPGDPGIDWAAVWTLLGWGFLLVLVLAGWWLWRTRFARTARWQRQARSVKSQWQKPHPEGQDDNATQPMRWQLYALFQSAPFADFNADSKADAQKHTTDRNSLQALCFSTQPVSRETLLSELTQLMQRVDQAAQLKARHTVHHAWQKTSQRLCQSLFQRRQR